MKTRVVLENGKYEVVIENGAMKALRHGEEWRNLAGDKLIFAMVCKIEDLQGDLREAAIAIRPHNPELAEIYDRKAE